MSGDGGAIRAIGKQDINLIQSAQVITSITDAAKELFENAIDAGARKICIKLTTYGLDCLEVSDDGCGIAPEDFATLAASHATSKLRDFADLTGVATLGFRGEALSALCALSTLVVTTCTPSTYPLGHALTFAADGSIAACTRVSCAVGTRVNVTHLFASLPVRRRDFEKHAKRDLMATAKVLQAHAAIREGVRVEAISVVGNHRTHLLGKHGTLGHGDLRRNISDLFGAQLHQAVVPIDTLASFQSTHQRREGVTVVRMVGYISNLQKDYGQKPERQLTYINSRPCHLQKLLRTVNETCASLGANRPPFVLLNLIMPPDAYDVNVSPNKRTIFLHDEQVILQHLREAITELFSNDQRTIPMASMAKINSIEATLARDVMTQGDVDMIAQEDDLVNVPELSEAVSENQAPSNRQARWKQAVDVTHTIVPSINSQLGDFRRSDGALQLPKQDGIHSSDQIDRIDAAPAELSENTHANFLREASPPLPDDAESVLLKRKRSLLIRETSRTLKQSRLATGRQESATSNEPGAPIDSSSESNDDTEQRQLEIPMDTMPKQTELGMASAVSPGGDDQARQSPDVTDVPVRPLQRFIKRLQNFEHSTPSHHVHDIEVSLDTTAVLPTQRRPLRSVDDPGPTRAKLSNAGIQDTSELAEQILSLNVSKSDFFGMTVIGQFNLGFILVERGHELFIIDQHASDEKSNYERLLRDTVIQNQPLAQPKELELSAMERLSIDEHLETLKKNGFNVVVKREDVSGETKYCLEGLPTTRKTTFGVSDLLEILHLLMEGSPPELVRCTKARRMFASRACRSSIMIGTALSHEKMQAVVWHLGELDAPWNCPHGRPTMRHLVNTGDLPSFMADYD